MSKDWKNFMIPQAPRPMTDKEIIAMLKRENELLKGELEYVYRTHNIKPTAWTPLPK